MKQGSFNVVLDGRGTLTLRESNYVTSGGEGSIYIAGNTVVKIYLDAKKFTQDGMDKKIQALSSIKHPSIVGPQGVVSNEKKEPIGFYMPVASGEPMPRVFTSDFRGRFGFDDDGAKAVVGRMRDATQCAHDGGAIMVDANEFNWIVDPKKLLPFVIDVDSWSTGKWKPTVIMPSIRDWNSKTFDTMTDWFSWGVVAFQVFTGIHPYKGRLDGYKPGDLTQRMKDNASVFAPGVRLPQSARDPSCIPGPLLDWFKAEFQGGQRSLPPASFDGARAKVATVMRSTVGHVVGLIHERIGRFDDVVAVWPCGAALLKDGRLLSFDGALDTAGKLSPDGEVIRSKSALLLAEADGRQFWCFNNRVNTKLEIMLQARGVFRSGDRLFAITESDLVELKLMNEQIKPLLVVGQRWGIRPNATKWFDGVAVQDVLGASHLVFPTETGMVQPRVRELDGLTPVAGIGLGRFASLIAADVSGSYHRVEITFNSGHSDHKVWVGPNDGPDLNMTVLPKGVVATVVNDGEIVIFVPANGSLSRVQDAGISTSIRLSRWRDRVVYIRSGELWSTRIK